MGSHSYHICLCCIRWTSELQRDWFCLTCRHGFAGLLCTANGSEQMTGMQMRGMDSSWGG